MSRRHDAAFFFLYLSSLSTPFVGFSFLSFCALLGHTVVGFSLSNSKDWAA
jgi:hypothetical protein